MKNLFLFLLISFAVLSCVHTKGKDGKQGIPGKNAKPMNTKIV